MLNLRSAIIGGICLLVSAPMLWADSYQCTFKPSRMEKGLIPVTLRIDWPNYLKPAHITDSITEANGFRNVVAKNPIENDKRVKFAWKLDQIFVPNLSSIVGARSNGKVDVKYRAVIYQKSSKVVLMALPTVRLLSSNGVRAEGRCKAIK